MPSFPPEPDFESVADAVLKEHATELGRVAIAWNAIQESCARLFGEIVGRPHVAYAAFWAVKSDRYQRDMLLAAARADLPKDSLWLVEIVWAMARIDTLEDARNNFLHSGYATDFSDGEEFPLKVVPNGFPGHARSKKLEGYGSLREKLKAFCTDGSKLSFFVFQLGHLHEEWAKPPQRPGLTFKV